MFRVRLAGPERNAPALALPDKPSIAVLPFQNMSGDPEQEYFADGMVEEITTALSRSPLAVRHRPQLELSPTRAAPSTSGRSAANLVCATCWKAASARLRRACGSPASSSTRPQAPSGRPVQGDLTDIFELQDQVTISVVAAIQPKIRRAEVERTLHKPTEKMFQPTTSSSRRAYDLQQRDSLEVAADFYRRAIALDPNYAIAYALLAMTLWITAAFQWTEPSERELSEYVGLAKTAIRLGSA